MKIRIENACGYEGLLRAKFPLILEADVRYSELVRVSYETMSQVEGWYWSEEDAREGEDYVFLPHEYEVVH